MESRDIARLRLNSQGIAGSRLQKPAEVVSWMGAIQAQDYAGAKWSIGLRANAAIGHVDQAIAGREIIRTWLMRGTLHVASAADIRWMLQLLAPGIIAGRRTRCRQLELDDAVFKRSRKLFEGALSGGRQLTREELYRVLERKGIPAGPQRGYHILSRAGLDGVICFGAGGDARESFALLEEWAPPAGSVSREEALAALALRYFSSRGPATLQDFVWWSGLKASDAREGLALVSSQLMAEKTAGRVCWLAPVSTASRPLSLSVHLLPGFDEYLLGYRDRSAVLEARHAPLICPGGNGMFMPTIAVNGCIAGIWKRTIGKCKVSLAPTPFSPLGAAASRALSKAAERYGAFLGLPVTLPPL